MILNGIKKIFHTLRPHHMLFTIDDMNILFLLSWRRSVTCFFTGDNNSSTTAVDKWSSKVIYVLIGLNIFSGDFRRAYRKEAFNLYIDEGELFVWLQIESFLAKRGPVLVHFFIQTTMFPCSFLRHRKSLMFGMPSLDQFVWYVQKESMILVYPFPNQSNNFIVPRVMENATTAAAAPKGN